MISIDYIYKTNRYGLPLLDIIGFTATRLTFYLGFAFIRDKKDNLYKISIYLILLFKAN
jgi:hypothetical protein